MGDSRRRQDAAGLGMAQEAPLGQQADQDDGHQAQVHQDRPQQPPLLGGIEGAQLFFPGVPVVRGRLGGGLDEAAMRQAVDGSLYRNRSESSEPRPG